MIEKLFVIVCDWCGCETLVHKTQMDEAYKKYAKDHCLYEYKSVNPVADELFLKSHGFVFKHHEFCCEECAEKWFEENPDCRGHYKIIKPKK